MAEPASTSLLTVAYFSATKLWSIVSGVCGSVIPILALADKAKVTIFNAFFMALTGTSFSVFVGPWLAERLNITSIEGIVALAWIMGVVGVYVVRGALKWLEDKSAEVVGVLLSKILGFNSEK